MVFEFVFSDRSNVARFRDRLTADVPVDLLTLWAPLRTVKEREAARPGRQPLGPRVAECWHELHAHLDELGTIIDATQPLEAVITAAQAALTQAGQSNASATAR